ncbi:MAG: hypothetical protein ACFFAU_18970 [Candidatus Hodarchaeota archaeon]
MKKNTLIALISLCCFLLLIIRMILVQPKFDLSEMDGLGEAIMFLVMVFQLIIIVFTQKKP